MNWNRFEGTLLLEERGSSATGACDVSLGLLECKDLGMKLIKTSRLVEASF